MVPKDKLINKLGRQWTPIHHLQLTRRTTVMKVLPHNARVDFKYCDYLSRMNEMVRSREAVGDNIVGVAVVGLGRIGTIHFEGLYRNPRATVLYCIEESYERRVAVSSKWHLTNSPCNMRGVQGFQEALDDPRVHAVFICTPTFTHKSLTMRALEAGKAVFCEKPVAEDYDTIAQCYSLAKTKNVPLFCAFNRRFDPGLSDICRRVRAGEVGQVNVVKTCSRDSPVPPVEYLRTSGGIFHDCAVHDLDLICWVIGEYPNKVSSFATLLNPNLKELDDFDTVQIALHFPSGIIGAIDLSRNSSYGYDQRLEVFGSQGLLSCGNMKPTAVVHESDTGAHAQPMWYSFASRYERAYKEELDYFLDVLSNNEIETLVTKNQTLAITKIASACEESARKGKVINLEWDNAEL
ncbi:uncharacterized oxidoreductase YrbE-like isoform X2 [Ornithodoros turicata]